MRSTPLIALVVSTIGGCLLDWDTVDPRARNSAGGTAEPATSSSSGTAGGGQGGASSSSTSSAGGGGGLPWFDPAWPRRRAIDVGTVSGGPHTDFVVRVRLDETRIDMNETNDGQNLRFVADDHSTRLTHAVETWSGTGEVWVRLPRLDTGERFFMYYGNPGLSTDAQVPFTSSYAAVWHLSDYSDASSSGLTANPASAAILTEGVIGDASVHLTTTPTHINVPAAPAINDLFAAGGTVSAWVRATTTGGSGFGRIVDKALDTSGTNGWTLHVRSASPLATAFGLSFERGYSVSPSNVITSSLTLMALNQWHHIAVVHDDTVPAAAAVYVDGQPVSVDITMPAGAPQNDALVDAKIGNRVIDNNRSFDGLIDEVRLESVARPAGWIEADYRSGADQLLTFGPEEVCPPRSVPDASARRSYAFVATMEHVVRTATPPFTTSSGRLEVHQIPAWQDNLIWLLVDKESKEAAAIDGPPAADQVLAYCEARGLRLTAIFNTHTHPDHIGINMAFEQKGQLKDLRVVGAKKRASEIPGLTEAVDEGDTLLFGSVEGTVMLTEGHIDGHVSYVFDDVVFCGDTLFAAGCGYLFDGPPDKMHESLRRLSELAPETRVCCAHEYTEDNLRFAWSVEPDNDALAARIREVWTLRARGECSVPSTVGVERATNPFLRFGEETVKNTVRAAFPDDDLGSSVAVFAATRRLKDRKDYRQRGDDVLPLDE